VEVSLIANLYCISCKTHFKVGITSDPGKRLCALQTGNPHKLRFIRVSMIHATNPDYIPRQTEKAIHDKLYEFQANGEWFIQNKDSLSVLNKCFDILVDFGWKEITSNFSEAYKMKDLNSDAVAIYEMEA